MRAVRPLLVFAALLLAACPAAPPSTDTAADEQAIRAQVDVLNQAIASQNDSLIGALYTEDAVLLPPGMRRVNGREQIRAFWASLWSMKPTLTMTPVTITISGDLAIEEANYLWTIPTAAGGQEKEEGKSLVTWRRSGNSWVIVQNMWNADSRATVVTK
jgi:uncharacterized protein (TIGR02246 family)